jgi:thioredoxin 1
MEETTTPPAAEEHAALTLTDDNFADEVQSFKGLVLVDFWAEWCTPCHVMAPRVEEVAAKFAGNPQIKVGKFDVDSNEKVAFEQRVMSLPTFRLFKDGEVIDELIGTRPAEDLAELITRNLTPAKAEA